MNDKMYAIAWRTPPPHEDRWPPLKWLSHDACRPNEGSFYASFGKYTRTFPGVLEAYVMINVHRKDGCFMGGELYVVEVEMIDGELVAAIQDEWIPRTTLMQDKELQAAASAKHKERYGRTLEDEARNEAERLELRRQRDARRGFRE